MRWIILASGIAALGTWAQAATIIQPVPLSPVVIVDNSSDTASTTITQSGIISSVVVTANLTSADAEIDDAGNPFGLGGDEFANELSLSISSPTGTLVDLILSGTYDGSQVGARRFEVTFDDLALTMVGGETLDGTFQPVGSLADFVGEEVMGAWVMTVGDNAVDDPKSLNSFTLRIETQSAVVPLPAALPMLAGGLALLCVVRRRKSQTHPARMSLGKLG